MVQKRGSMLRPEALAPTGLRLVVAPGAFFPDYATEVGSDVAGVLDLSSEDEALVLLVVNPGNGLADATANLAAPILVNPRTRRAVQAVQADADLPLRAPLLAPAAS